MGDVLIHEDEAAWARAHEDPGACRGVVWVWVVLGYASYTRMHARARMHTCTWAPGVGWRQGVCPSHMCCACTHPTHVHTHKRVRVYTHTQSDYQSKIEPTPAALVENGRFNLGTFIEPFHKVNPLDAELRQAGRVVPRFIKQLGLKEWQRFILANDRFFINLATNRS